MTSYTLNEDKMFADITDGIAIVINSETGIYYGMNEFGTVVFENLMNGVVKEDILATLQALNGVPADIEENLNEFVKSLVDWEILAEGDSGGTLVNISIDGVQTNDFQLDIKEYLDAQELLLADPIHMVKEETGWEPEKAALNPDERDIARRYAKTDEETPSAP